MSTSSIVLLVVHFGIFLLVKTRISRRKRELERENAQLRNENITLSSKAAYYERELTSKR